MLMSSGFGIRQRSRLGFLPILFSAGVIQPLVGCSPADSADGGTAGAVTAAQPGSGNEVQSVNLSANASNSPLAERTEIVPTWSTTHMRPEPSDTDTNPTGLVNSEATCVRLICTFSVADGWPESLSSPGAPESIGAQPDATMTIAPLTKAALNRLRTVAPPVA